MNIVCIATGCTTVVGQVEGSGPMASYGYLCQYHARLIGAGYRIAIDNPPVTGGGPAPDTQAVVQPTLVIAAPGQPAPVGPVKPTQPPL